MTPGSNTLHKVTWPPPTKQITNNYIVLRLPSPDLIFWRAFVRLSRTSSLPPVALFAITPIHTDPPNKQLRAPHSSLEPHRSAQDTLGPWRCSAASRPTRCSVSRTRHRPLPCATPGTQRKHGRRMESAHLLDTSSGAYTSYKYPNVEHWGENMGTHTQNWYPPSKVLQSLKVHSSL